MVMILIILLLGLLSYFMYRSYILAGLLAEHMDYSELLETRLTSVNSMIKNTYEEMKLIDRKQIFEKDDDVGTTFALLKQVIDDLEEYVNIEEVDAQKEKEK